MESKGHKEYSIIITRNQQQAASQSYAHSVIFVIFVNENRIKTKIR